MIWPAPGWKVHDIAPDLRLRVVREMPLLPADIEDRINKLWDIALRRTDGKLFNGRVFSADHIAHGLIRGHWTEFRRIVAQMEQPEIFSALCVRPVAVNGVTIGPDGVVMGRRPDDAVYQAGLWQMPPAGSIDNRTARPDGEVDVAAQVLGELLEELGIASNSACVGRPLALVEHADSHVLDLGIELATPLTAAEIIAAHAKAGNAEYASIQVIGRTALPSFVRDAGAALVPQAHVFLTKLGLLPLPRLNAADGFSG